MLNFEILGVQPINKGLTNCNVVTNQRPSLVHFGLSVMEYPGKPINVYRV